MTHIVDWINHIGLSAKIVDKLPFAGTHLKHVFIYQGEIHATNEVAIGDLLHEAGHLAIIPPSLRHKISNDVYKSIQRLEGVDWLSELGNKLMYCGEQAATAWTWAAGKYLQIKDDDIIFDKSYGGKGADIKHALLLKCYSGINELVHSGMIETKQTYPVMKRWVQT